MNMTFDCEVRYIQNCSDIFIAKTIADMFYDFTHPFVIGAISSGLNYQSLSACSIIREYRVSSKSLGNTLAHAATFRIVKRKS